MRTLQARTLEWVAISSSSFSDWIIFIDLSPNSLILLLAQFCCWGPLVSFLLFLLLCFPTKEFKLRSVLRIKYQFSSVTQSCPALWSPMDCSMPAFPVFHYVLEFSQTHLHWIGEAIQPISSSVALFSSYPQSFPASGYFSMSQLFTSGGQSVGASTSASVLPINTQGWLL